VKIIVLVSVKVGVQVAQVDVKQDVGLLVQGDVPHLVDLENNGTNIK